MAITGIHHVAVVVPSLDAGLAFYGDVLGFELVERADYETGAKVEAITGLSNGGAKSAMLKAAWGYLELFEFHEQAESLGNQAANVPGIRHFCLTVDDLATEYEKLRPHMSFHTPPVDLGWASDGEGPWVTYGRDPFGNILELWELSPEDPQPFAPISQSKRETAQ
jgi:glyoxylase I family protein